jgi:hypothetical protein
MKINQLFCNHIWETSFVHLIGQSMRYVVDTPISEKKRYLVQSRCVKCGKIKKEEQEKERSFSIEEVKILMENDRIKFKPWEK